MNIEDYGLMVHYSGKTESLTKDFIFNDDYYEISVNSVEILEIERFERNKEMQIVISPVTSYLDMGETIYVKGVCSWKDIELSVLRLIKNSCRHLNSILVRVNQEKGALEKMGEFCD